MASNQQFTTTATAAGRGRVLIPVPFDPDTVWAAKLHHHIAGTVNHMPVRGVVEPAGDGFGFTLGPAWLRDCGLAPGRHRRRRHPSRRPATRRPGRRHHCRAGRPPAGRGVFDSLAQFYRAAYLRWIDATKRRPDRRAARISEMIQLLEAGQKQPPKPQT